MNILFVTSEFPVTRTSPTGGIGTYLLNLATQLRKSKHNVYIVTRKEKKRYQHKGIKIIDIDCRISKRHIKDLSVVGKLVSFLEYPVIFSIKTALSLNKIIKKNNIDIIEGNDFGGDLWFYLLNPFIRKPVPVVIRLHTPYFIISKYNNDSGSIAGKLMSFIEKTVITLADGVYSPTESLAVLIRKATGRKINKIIPYPFDTRTKKSPQVRRREGTILYVGKLQHKKGVFTLLKATQQLKRNNKSIYCYFVGPDTIFKDSWVSDLMKQKASQLKISKNIEIINKNISKKELIGYYKKSSMLVVPSLWENFPNVILEAFSIGTPVVAASVGGIPEMIVDGYNGLLYKSDNVKLLANAVLIILNNPNFGRKISINSYKTLSNIYNAKKNSAQTVGFYKDILNRKYKEKNSINKYFS